MKAFFFHEYGGSEVLRLEDVEAPEPKDDEVRVRVRAASVNPLDWRLMRGEPYAIRIATGVGKPKVTRIGVDAAGVVEAVGKNVTDLRVGDEVFGATEGAFAESVTRPAAEFAPKPANLTFEEAAAVPVGAITSLQALRDSANVQAGQKVLIHGAAGGVGTYAVQIAKSFGGEVTGVCSTRNVELVRSLGADHVIDYTREDFTRGTARYDVIVDNIGDHSLRACRRVLTPGGVYVAVGGPAGPWIGPLVAVFKPLLVAPFVRKHRMKTCMSRPSRADLLTLASLLEAGTIRSIIDRTYPLTELPAAIRYSEEGHARGKIVITL